MTRVTFQIRQHLKRFLDEDIGKKDITSVLLPKGAIAARIITKNDAVIAGAEYAKAIFALYDCRCKILKKDGSKATSGDVIMNIKGKAYNILVCERTALNLLSRMSGIATTTAQLVDMLPKGVELYATRKTAPGLRIFDKTAVEIGGAKRHRMRLDESVMIKDNHIAAAMIMSEPSEKYSTGKAIQHLVAKAKQKHKKIEVEVESAKDAIVAARAGATTVMLDNFTPAGIKKTVKLLKEAGQRDKIRIEASGKITKKNISKYAASTVDMISVGVITNSPTGIDFSLEL